MLAEAHRAAPRRSLFHSRIGACFLLSKPLSNLAAMQLHQIPLANQSGKAGFGWEFYLGPCKMRMHKELQKTGSLQVCLTNFLCPHFPGVSSQTLASIFSRCRTHGPHQAVEKPHSLFLHSKRRAAHVKSFVYLWVWVAGLLHVRP